MVGALVCLSLAPATAQAAWEQLGCRKVGFLVDKDVIHVGRAEGRFRSIRLLVSGNKVHMMDLKVIYANGQPDDIPGVVAFLASDEAAFITGQVLSVSGGLTMAG